MKVKYENFYDTKFFTTGGSSGTSYLEVGTYSNLMTPTKGGGIGIELENLFAIFVA